MQNDVLMGSVCPITQWKKKYAAFSKTLPGQALFLTFIFFLFRTGIIWKLLNLLFIAWWLAPFLFLLVGKFSPKVRLPVPPSSLPARRCVCSCHKYVGGRCDRQMPLISCFTFHITNGGESVHALLLGNSLMNPSKEVENSLQRASPLKICMPFQSLSGVIASGAAPLRKKRDMYKVEDADVFMGAGV